MAANMWKNGLKNVQSDNNKILYENLIDFFTGLLTASCQQTCITYTNAVCTVKNS